MLSLRHLGALGLKLGARLSSHCSALARRLAAEDERPADAWANAPAPPKDDGWARERERRRRRAGDDGPSEELREFSGERKGDDLDEIDI